MQHPWLISCHSLTLFSHSCSAPTDYLTACCYFYLVASLLSCLSQLLLCLPSSSACKIAGWRLFPTPIILEGFSFRFPLKSASSFNIPNLQQAWHDVVVISYLSLPAWQWWTTCQVKTERRANPCFSRQQLRTSNKQKEENDSAATRDLSNRWQSRQAGLHFLAQWGLLWQSSGGGCFMWAVISLAGRTTLQQEQVLCAEIFAAHTAACKWFLHFQHVFWAEKHAFVDFFIFIFWCVCVGKD